MVIFSKCGVLPEHIKRLIPLTISPTYAIFYVFICYILYILYILYIIYFIYYIFYILYILYIIYFIYYIYFMCGLTFRYKPFKIWSSATPFWVGQIVASPVRGSGGIKKSYVYKNIKGLTFLISNDNKAKLFYMTKLYEVNFESEWKTNSCLTLSLINFGNRFPSSFKV